MAKAARLKPDLLKFLTDLKKNNNRDWFTKNNSATKTKSANLYSGLLPPSPPGSKKSAPTSSPTPAKSAARCSAC